MTECKTTLSRRKLNDARDQPTLPENFFPKTLDISTYIQIQKKIEDGEANCPAADDAHVAKRLQSNEDKKKACNQAKNLQISVPMLVGIWQLEPSRRAEQWR